MSSTKKSRRQFLNIATGTTLAAAAAPGLLAAPKWSSKEAQSGSANDRIQIATIGMGIIGFEDTKTALKVPGVDLVAVAGLLRRPPGKDERSLWRPGRHDSRLSESAGSL